MKYFRFLCVLGFCLFSYIIYAQTDSANIGTSCNKCDSLYKRVRPSSDSIFINNLPECLPMFPSGDKALFTFLANNKGNMNDLYHSIGTNKVLMSYPNGGMNHMVNLQGAYRQIITYPSGGTSSRIMYHVLDNGKHIVRSASFFINKSTSLFRIF